MSEESLMDFMFELNDFRLKKANYNLNKCSIVLTYDFFIALKEKIDIDVSDDKVAKALLNNDVAVRINDFDRIKMIISFGYLGGYDYMIVRKNKSDNGGLTYEDKIPSYIKDII